MIKGHHVLFALIGFFGVTIAVNVLFITLALRTFSGEGTPRSYVQGLLVCEKLRGALGIAQPIGRARLEAMVAGARAPSSAGWAPDAFRRGVLDMEASGLTLGGIRAFLTSARCAVPYAELELITRDLGCGGLPPTWRVVGSK